MLFNEQGGLCACMSVLLFDDALPVSGSIF